MIKSKMENFSNMEVRLAAIAKALSHPARVRILKILTSRNACICGDIVELLPLAQSTVSQHLKELKKVGLVQGDIEGPRTCYCLNPKILSTARDEFHKLFSTICCR
jgi:ArsR family transcriptional regulator